MPKESLVLRLCDFVTKYSIYAVVFLVPIFFLPWTTDVLDFNKQSLVLVLVFVSFFATMLKILVLGKFELKKSFMHIVAGILFLVYLLATVFSISGHGSFWGQPQQVSESMLTLVSLLLFYFLVSNVFSKKEIFTSVVILSFSAVIAQLIGIFQLFGLFILPFDFAKSTIFNTIGSAGSLGIFSAVLLPLATILLITAKRSWKILFILQIVLSAVILFLINYPIIWWVVLASSALILALGVIKRDLFDGRWMVIPMFFLAVSLFFLVLNLQINVLPQKVNEVFLSQKAGLSMGIQAIKEKPILGSGPGTFSYDFSKFKSPDFSKTSLWNVTFNKSSSKVLNSLATTGILGFLAILALIILPIYYGIRFIISKNSLSSESEIQNYNILLIGLFVVLVGQGIAYFLYNSNVTLDFVYFFAIGALVNLISTEKREYALKSSSFLTLMVTFIFTLVFIFGMGILILNGQRYMAEVDYYKGLVNYQAGQKAEGLKNLELAASLNSSSDLYFRQLAQAYLLGLQDELQSTNSTTPSDQEKTKVQNLLANSINAGKIATDLNPMDVNNWSSRGYVYQNLLGVSADASTWAINSYDAALKLDPNNPYLFTQEGNVYLAEAVSLPSTASADQKSQLLAKARDQLEKALTLNPSYSNALYPLGIVYDYLGLKDKAIAAFTQLQQLNPQNTDIPKILDNLNAGRPALQTATSPVENPPSGTTGTVTNPPAKTSTNPDKTTTK